MSPKHFAIVYNIVMAKDKTASKNKAAKIKKPTLKKKQSKTSKSGMSLYSNLAYKRRVREDARARKKRKKWLSYLKTQSCVSLQDYVLTAY